MHRKLLLELAARKVPAPGYGELVDFAKDFHLVKLYKGTYRIYHTVSSSNYPFFILVSDLLFLSFI